MPSTAQPKLALDSLSDRLRSAISSLAHSIDEEAPSDRGPAYEILTEAAAMGATDVHVSAGEEGGTVRFRLDGSISDIASLDREQTDRLVRQLEILAGIDLSRRLESAHGHATLELLPGKHTGVRVTMTPTVSGRIVAIRLLDPERVVRPLEGLGLPREDLQHIRTWMETCGGLMLIAGPTGSGKTTSLYAFLNHLRSPEQRVLTVEDPVESSIPGVDQIQVERRRGIDMASAIDTALRLDPDLIAIGEVRDPGSARAAVAACLSGHAVLTTAHAPSPAGVVTLLRHCGVSDFEIGATLGMSISQRLIRTLCPECREEQSPDERHHDLWKAAGLEPPESQWYAPGCPACHGKGFRGRTGIFEVWRPSAEEQDYIRDGQSETVLNIPNNRAQTTLLHRGLSLAAEGRTTPAEVRRVCGLAVGDLASTSRR